MKNPVRPIKEGIPLKDPRKHEFGSVAWQDTMTHNILHKINHGEQLGAAERHFLSVQEMHIGRLLTNVYYNESDLEKARRIRRGYTKLRIVDAKKLKEMWEKGHEEPLAWNPGRLDSAIKRNIYDSYALVYWVDQWSDGYHTHPARIDVADGRHRIAAAAQKGHKIKIAFFRDFPDKIIKELE
jgi:hypothetical protein